MNFYWFKWRYFLYLFLFGLWCVWFINLIVLDGAVLIAPDCDKNVNKYPIAIVLGARVIGEKQVSDIYADRLQEAVNIYKNNKVSKILVSGDHEQVSYDEVNAGKDYLLNAGVASSDIYLDHSGLDTFRTMYRAKYLFGIKRALIITQNFHLPRALYLANELDLEVLGCSADLRTYQDIKKLEKREIFARIKAWINITFLATPKYMGSTYNINDRGEETWD
jgi:SanA protein